MDEEVQHCRQDSFVRQGEKKVFFDVACPFDTRILQKEQGKMEKISRSKVRN